MEESPWNPFRHSLHIRGVQVSIVSIFLIPSCRTLSELLYRERQVPFDFAFDSASDAELYCTELVAAALLRADSLLPIRPSISVAGRRVYSLDDLLLLPGTKCMALAN